MNSINVRVARCPSGFLAICLVKMRKTNRTFISQVLVLFFCKLHNNTNKVCVCVSVCVCVCKRLIKAAQSD